jgi:CDP-diacylglycerol--serine O-phosphatidyltransferase
VTTTLKLPINLANGITSLSIAASLSAMFLAAHGRIVTALLVGAVTLPCDVFDGVIARRRKTTSSFGAQLDSLSDAIGFGVLPAFLGFVHGINGMAAVVLIVYALGAVWRLAFFHEVGMTVDASGREYFRGMPTTLAGALFYVIAPASLWLTDRKGLVLLFLFYLVATFLMNSLFLFPKRSWASRVLWVLIPIALGSLALRGGFQ